MTRETTRHLGLNGPARNAAVARAQQLVVLCPDAPVPHVAESDPRVTTPRPAPLRLRRGQLGSRRAKRAGLARRLEVCLLICSQWIWSSPPSDWEGGSACHERSPLNVRAERLGESGRDRGTVASRRSAELALFAEVRICGWERVLFLLAGTAGWRRRRGAGRPKDTSAASTGRRSSWYAPIGFAPGKPEFRSWDGRHLAMPSDC